MNKRIILGVVGFIVAYLIGSSVFQSKSSIIKAVVKGGQEARGSVLGQGTYESYNVYKDGNADGVVFEYVFKSELKLDENNLNSNNLKTDLIKELKRSNEASSIKKVLDKDIYMKYIYKQNGSVLGSAQIDKNDFR